MFEYKDNTTSLKPEARKKLYEISHLVAEKISRRLLEDTTIIAEDIETEIAETITLKIENKVLTERLPIVDVKYPFDWKNAVKKYIIEEKLMSKFPKLCNWFLNKYPIVYAVTKIQPIVSYNDLAFPNSHYKKDFEIVGKGWGEYKLKEVSDVSVS